MSLPVLLPLFSPCDGAGLRSAETERSILTSESLLGLPPQDDKIENVIPSVTQWSAGIRSLGICHAERSATKCEHPPPQDDRRGCGLRQDDTLCHCEWSEMQRGNHRSLTPSRHNQTKRLFLRSTFRIFGCAEDTHARQCSNKFDIALAYSYLCTGNNYRICNASLPLPCFRPISATSTAIPG